MRFKSITIGIASLLLIGTGGWSYAQHMMNNHQMGHQMNNTLGTMSEMGTMMEQMSQMMERSQGLSKTFGTMMMGHHGEMENQAQMMQQMSQSMETMAKEMKSNLQLCNTMLQNDAMMKDHTMQQEVGNLANHMDGMAKQMQGAVGNLETMSKSLKQESAGK
jgi:archaellum component FlaC